MKIKVNHVTRKLSETNFRYDNKFKAKKKDFPTFFGSRVITILLFKTKHSWKWFHLMKINDYSMSKKMENFFSFCTNNCFSSIFSSLHPKIKNEKLHFSFFWITNDWHLLRCLFIQIIEFIYYWAYDSVVVYSLLMYFISICGCLQLVAIYSL